MNERYFYELLEKTGVILEGHFLLTSGRHSGRFLQCSQVMQYPEHLSKICQHMAEPFFNRDIEVVIGPAMGGVILAYEMARLLGARAIYAEHAADAMVLKRGFRVGKGEKALVVEDTVTTGGSVKKVIDLLEAARAEIIGISAIIDRTAGKVDFGLPFQSLLGIAVKSYLPEECPLCRSGIALQMPKARSGA